MPKVSVIIPTYNRACLVKEAVESVLEQSFSDYEVIVVDDGSTDNTADLIRKILDSRMRYFYKENGGVASALNFGFAKSSGKYIATLDSDDLWTKDFLKIMVSTLEEEPDYGLAYSLFEDYHLDGTIEYGFSSDRFMSGWVTLSYYRRPPHILPSTTLCRRNFWQETWQDEMLKTANDTDFFLRLSTKTQFLFVEGVWLKRRRTPNSASSKEFDFNPIFIFERFYFNLGGDKIIPRRIAYRWFSRCYRGMARQYYKAKSRQVAISLFKKAICYYPFDRHNHRGFIKALFLKRSEDKLPDWQMPASLPPYITVAGRKISVCNSVSMYKMVGIKPELVPDE